MIKKVAVFLLLIVTGFAALFVATGDDAIAKFGSGAAEITKTTVEDDANSGVVVELDEDRGTLGDELKFNYSGPIGGLTLSWRKFVLADGRQLELPLYVVKATNSQQLPDGRVELSGAEVLFYDIAAAAEPGGDPRAVEAARLLAKQAFVELGSDEKGRPAVAQDRDIDLIDAVLETAADSRVKNLRMSIERALIRSTETAVQIATAHDDLPVKVEMLDSDAPAVLTGRGLLAVFPLRSEDPTADGQDETPPATTGPITVEVKRDPLLIHSGPDGRSRLEADGPLHYREDPDNAVAEITVHDNVRIETAAGTSSADGNPIVATGDLLRAQLRRGRSSEGGSGLRWRNLHLVGAPTATLGAQGMNLTCATVDITPSLAGEPWLFTASGEPHLRQEIDGQVMLFTASDRIHLVRLPEHLEPWLGGRGWQRNRINPQPDQLLIFRGASSLTLPHEGGELVLDASEGLRVLRGENAGGAASIVGLGNVDLHSRGTATPLDVRGSDGFLLHLDPIRGQDLRLGPAVDSSRLHAFAVKSGDLEVAGTGSCRIFRPAEPELPGRIELVSPTADIVLGIPDADGSLRQVARLEAAFGATGVTSFDARGPACQLDWQNDRGRIEGTATRIWSTDESVYYLGGAPAKVFSEQEGGTFEGETIRIVRLSEAHTLLEARTNARLVIERLPGSEQGRTADEAASGIDVAGDRITYLPFLMPTAARLWSLPGLPQPGMHQPYLVARGHVVVRQSTDADADEPSRATGELLVLQLGDEPRGQLRGTPATLTRRDAAGQQLIGEAPAILLTGAGDELQLRPGVHVPVRFKLGNRKGALAGFGSQGEGSTLVVCDGPVDADHNEIRFDGPVLVRSLDADGEVDARGFWLDAQRMRMVRDPDSGEIVQIDALAGSHLRWRQIDAVAEELSLNLVTHFCSIIDRKGTARVSLPNGTLVECGRARFNYLTYESTAWNIQVAGDRAAK